MIAAGPSSPAIDAAGDRIPVFDASALDARFASSFCTRSLCDLGFRSTESKRTPQRFGHAHPDEGKKRRRRVENIGRP